MKKRSIILTFCFLLCCLMCAGETAREDEVSRHTFIIDGEEYTLIEYESNARTEKGETCQTSVIDGLERQIKMTSHGTSYEYVITPKDKDGNLIPELAAYESGVYRSLIKN